MSTKSTTELMFVMSMLTDLKWNFVCYSISDYGFQITVKKHVYVSCVLKIMPRADRQVVQVLINFMFLQFLLQSR